MKPVKRTTLYSRAGAPRAPAAAAAGPSAPSADAATPAAPAGRRARLMAAVMRHDRPLLFALGAVLVLAALLLQQRITPAARVLTQKDIDRAVLHTLATKPIPSAAARAYENVRPSLVRVRGMVPGDDGKMIEGGVGSGVVIVDSGLILTNLHVVSQAKELRVVFHDGTEAGANLVSAQPEHDLAVIKAKVVPDDMKPATLRSTGDLLPGDRVVAAGFPFGIGPSVSEGVVSGLKREFRSADGSRKLTNLIQFDAAANPGSSGGPLITMDGEVVGIVTAILNPSEQRVFIGIGFAVPIENAASGVGVHPF